MTPPTRTIVATFFGITCALAACSSTDGGEPGALTANVEETTTIEAESDPALDFLGAVWNVTTISDDGLVARLFETGGGDPSANGNYLLVNLMQYPDSYTFDTGLNVLAITDARFEGDNGFVIETVQQQVDDSEEGDGNIFEVNLTSKFSYKLDRGVLQPVLIAHE